MTAKATIAAPAAGRVVIAERAIFNGRTARINHCDCAAKTIPHANTAIAANTAGNRIIFKDNIADDRRTAVGNQDRTAIAVANSGDSDCPGPEAVADGNALDDASLICAVIESKGAFASQR